LVDRYIDKKNKRINSFFEIDKKEGKMKTRRWGCSSHKHNDDEMKACDDFWINICTLVKWKINILVIYIGKKYLKILIMIQLFDKFKNMKKQMTII